MELAADVYQIATDLPIEERFGISLQLRRAAVSIPSNIAEGAGYGISRRNLHHLRIALGSDLELQTQLTLLARLQLSNLALTEPALGRATEVGKMLNGLIKSLQQKLEPSTPNY